MNDAALNTLDQIQAFLAGTSIMEFSFVTTTGGKIRLGRITK